MIMPEEVFNTLAEITREHTYAAIERLTSIHADKGFPYGEALLANLTGMITAIGQVAAHVITEQPHARAKTEDALVEQLREAIATALTEGATKQ